MSSARRLTQLRSRCLWLSENPRIRPGARSPLRLRRSSRGEPTRLAISAPSKAYRSEPFNVTIVAIDQFGHPADRQPISLDLRSEGKLIGRVSPDTDTGLLVSEQTVNELSVSRFEARSPWRGCEGNLIGLTSSALPIASCLDRFLSGSHASLAKRSFPARLSRLKAMTSLAPHSRVKSCQ